MKLTNDTKLFIIVLSALIAITLVLVVYYICNSDIQITYHISMDNNTLEAIKSINWTTIYNQSR